MSEKRFPNRESRYQSAEEFKTDVYHTVYVLNNKEKETVASDVEASRHDHRRRRAMMFWILFAAIIGMVAFFALKASAVNSEKYPDKQFAFEQSLPGIFHGTEGTTPVVVDIDYDKKGLFEIGFFEERRTEPAGLLNEKRDEKDVRYSGIGVLNRDKLEIVLKEKHREITAEHLERSVRHLTADITQADGKLTLTIPAPKISKEAGSGVAAVPSPGTKSKVKPVLGFEF